MSSAADETSDVLVLGASFAGLEFVHQLRRRPGGKDPRITVVDRQTEHAYLPLVHERLCGRGPAARELLPTADVLSRKYGATFVCDDVQAFDPETKTVTLGSGKTLRGKYVVVALGSTLQPPAAIPGHGGLRTFKFTPGQVQVAEALAASAGSRVVVVGGGLSGVEMSGELAALTSAKVTLVEAGERLLSGLHPGVGRRAVGALQSQGVDVRLRTKLMAVADGAVQIEGPKGAESLPCDLPLWAGGIRPAPVLAEMGLPLDERGWIRVGPTLQCFPTAADGRTGIYACGDAVRVHGGTGAWSTMQRAIECIWQAKVAAINVSAMGGAEDGYPALRPHRLREDFPHGVSLGRASWVVFGPLRIPIRGVNHWFRRWLMRQYFRRYGV